MGKRFRPSWALPLIKPYGWLILLAALAALGTARFSTAAPAQRGEPVYLPASSLKIADIEFEPEMAKSVSAWLSAIEKGDEAGAFAEVSKSLDVMNRMGTRNLFSLSELCLALGRKALSTGTAPMAVTVGRYATLFAPDNPDAHFFLARAHFEADKSDIAVASMSAVDGLKALARDRFSRDAFLSEAAIYLAMAALMTFGIAFLAFFARNHTAVFMNITDFIPSVQQGWWKVAAGLMIMLIPFAFGGWPFLLLFAPLFLWPTLNREGKAVAVAFAVVVILAPQLFGFMAKSAALSGADTYRALYLLSKNTWDYETKAALENERESQKENRLIAFALGLLNKMRKDKDASVEAYKAVLEIEKDNVPAMVNMGNAYYVAREYENAVFMYKKALEVNPQSVEAHFNLSVTYNETLRTKDSEAEYNRANTIDPKRAGEFVAATKDQDHDKKVVDFPITAEDLASYERELGEKTWEMAESMWKASFPAITMKTYMAVAAGYVVFLLFSHFFWNGRESHQSCSTCGSAFQPPVRLGVDQIQCNQCVAAQIMKSGVASAKKDTKRKEMREFKERRRLASVIMDGVAPGAGRLMANECVTGLFFAFITSVFIFYGVTNVVGSLLAQGVTPDAAIKPYVPFLVLAAVYWTLMNTAFRRDFY